MTRCSACGQRPSERKVYGHGLAPNSTGSVSCDDPIHDIADLAPEMLGALHCLVLNADLSRDPRMKNMTDCYLVPLDDIETARGILSKINKPEAKIWAIP